MPNRSLIHLFVLSTPNSGSTVLTKLLGTSPHASVFPNRKGEGQLLPEIQALKIPEPYNPDRALPWKHIKPIFNRYWGRKQPVRIEKSVYNVRHIPEIVKHFKHAHLLLLLRNPYAFCEGNKRRHNPKLSYTAIAQRWLYDLQLQIDATEQPWKSHFITYEHLCNEPETAAKELIAWCPALETLDTKQSFFIHNIEGQTDQPIVNLNQRQIQELTPSAIQEINAVLAPHQTLLDRFGYSLITENAAISEQNASQAVRIHAK